MENLESLEIIKNLKNERVILVPCDFSTLAFQAIEHGAFMAKAMHCRLVVLHVVTGNHELSLSTRKLRFAADDCSENFGVKPETIIIQNSSPYQIIKEVANELNPVSVILKTGGGMRTIEILSGTSIPFLVIQGQPKSEKFANIVFPINFLQKLDEKMKRVVHCSNYYPDAKMYIITPSGKGVNKERNVTANITLMTKVLKDQNIDVDFILHDHKKNTAEVIIELSKGMDLIVIQMEKSSGLRTFLFGHREEKLNTNAEKIPVLCFRDESDFK